MGKLENNQDYREALNAFRGFASLYVVVYHLRYFTDFDWFDTFPLLRFGYIGVDFFFILSGLVISHAYLHNSPDSMDNFWKKFFWYRLARLFPVHMLIMLVLLINALIHRGAVGFEGEELLDWFLLTALVHQWTIPDNYVWNGPAWSVSAEFFAYLIIFPAIKKIKTKRTNASLGVVMLCIGATMLALMIILAGTVNITNVGGPLIRVTGGFLCGTGVYLLLSSTHVSNVWDRFLGIALVCLPTLFLVAPILETKFIPVDMLLILGLTVTVSLAYIAQGTISTWLSQPKLFWLGEVSFSLYLCHAPVMQFFEFMATRFDWEKGFLFGCLLVLLSLAVAQILYRLVELPARSAMRVWIDKDTKSYTKINRLGTP